MSSGPTNPIRTTQTSFALLRKLIEFEGANLTELTDTVDVSKGAVYNHLATLEDIGVVTKSDRTYRVSPQMLQIGAASRDSLPAMKTAREKVWDLANTTGEFVSLVIHDDDSAVVLDTAIGELASIDRLALGQVLPLHSTAAGKAILSALDEDHSRRLCQMAAEKAAIDVDSLTEEIRMARAQGLAFSRGEFNADHYSVAAPVVIETEAEQLIYAIAISGPRDRLSGKALQQDVAGLVVRAANETIRLG